MRALPDERNQQVHLGEGGIVPVPRKAVDLSADPGVKRFAALLSDLVTSTGTNAEGVAAAAGLARSSLYAVLGGRRVPNGYFMERLLQVLETESLWPEKKLGTAVRRAESQYARLYRKLPKPRPPAAPVRVGVLPEQTTASKAFSAFLDEISQQGVNIEQLTWVSPAWLRRYAQGDSIPSWYVLDVLGDELKAHGISNAHTRLLALGDLAEAARAARAKERRWARVISGGSP
ncbi:hypothetical protein KPATCC21470_8724 [Kitasatospora purpeofusca]